MKWGDIYRTRDRVAERGHKPGFYVIVSRDFVAANDDLSTVICAPIYGELIGLRTEVPVGTDEGLAQESGIRCDFLMLMFKKRLTGFVSTLSASKQRELRRALGSALQLDR